jgi:Flp pilus assembly protein TadG
MFALLARAAPRTRIQRGQSLVEFALVLPVLMLLFVGIADFARWYSAAITIDSAAREAADYGAFQASNWQPVNVSGTVQEMQSRACTAASTLTGYQGDLPGTSPMSCSNPSFSYVLDNPGGSTDCSDGTQKPCRVDVTVTYTFQLFAPLPPVPQSITFSRAAVYAISPNLSAP